jgi:hypothetical protein
MREALRDMTTAAVTVSEDGATSASSEGIMGSQYLGFGGGVAPSFGHRRSDPGEAVAVAGGVVQVVGVVIVLDFCAAAIREAFRGRAGGTHTGRQAV